LTLSEFDDDKQAVFKVAIAEAAGVSTADVNIVKVESMSGARRGEEFLTIRRRLLAAGIRVDMSIKAVNQHVANTLSAELTITAINTKLQQAGLPVATMLESATITWIGEGNSTSDGASLSTSHGVAAGAMLPAIIGAAAGLAVLLAIIFFCYRWYTKAKTETRNAVGMRPAGDALGMRPPNEPEEISQPIRVNLPAVRMTVDALGKHSPTAPEEDSQPIWVELPVARPISKPR